MAAPDPAAALDKSKEDPPQSMLSAIDVHSSHESDLERDRHQHHDLEKQHDSAKSTEQETTTQKHSADDFNGPDDPDNAINWPTWKKMCHFWPVAFLAFAATAASSLITPANQDIQQYFGVSRTAAIVPLSVYVVGLGLGPVIAAPLSEQYGRSLVYKLSAPVFILFLIGSGFSTNFASLIICRLFAGIASAPVLAVGSGTQADLFIPRERALSTSIFIMMPFLGPALGPVIGGFAAQYKGWRWTIWCMIFIASVAFLSCLPMHETYKKAILKKRARQLGLPPPPGPKVMSKQYFRVLFTTTLIRPVSMIFTEPIVLAFGVYNSFTFAILFAFFAAYPYTFTAVYGFNTWQNGLTFIPIGIGVLLAVATSIICDRYIYLKKHEKAINEGKGMLAPEHRLYAGMMGTFGLPIGLFLFAWSARSDVHWIVPAIAGIPFAWANLTLFLSAVMYQVDVYGPLNGASAMAANGLMRYTTGGVFPLFAVQMYERLGIGWATSLLGFICVLMLPIPLVFYRYGPQIRKRSRYNIPST